MENKKSKTKRAIASTLFVTVILALLQLSRFGLERICFLFVAKTKFSASMATMLAMLVLTGALLIYARRRLYPLSVFPKRFGTVYIAASVFAALLFISTPIITGEWGIRPFAMIFYASVVTPLFEELVFRGFVWNKLNGVYKNQWLTYIVSSFLFALWHFGYIDGVAFRVETGLANIMLWKAITGLCFGLILGAVRLKTKNCYSTMLFHGVMNIFGR